MTAAHESCRLGYEEHDGSRYCFAHGGFAHYLMWGTLICGRARTARRLDPDQETSR